LRAAKPFAPRIFHAAPARAYAALALIVPVGATSDADMRQLKGRAFRANRYNRLTEEMSYPEPAAVPEHRISGPEAGKGRRSEPENAQIPAADDAEALDPELDPTEDRNLGIAGDPDLDPTGDLNLGEARDGDLDPDLSRELDSDPQPVAENGVDRDMASVALDSALLNGTPIEPARDRTEGSRIAGRAVGDWSAMSDAEIMLRVREGDDSGFDLLIQKYHRAIIHFMFRMVHNQAVAEELAQEVFLRVYRSRQTYRAEARFTTWLYRIATNLGVNYARDTKHERAAQNVYLDQPDPETGTTPDVADGAATVEQELVRDERMKAIRQHVMALPERQRTAVLMHKYQGLDYKQIGAVLKLSESATKSLLFRAYQTLRERLKDFV
jgi:RNA polymerase sigma-70 factor, ECF subfamily